MKREIQTFVDLKTICILSEHDQFIDTSGNNDESLNLNNGAGD